MKSVLFFSIISTVLMGCIFNNSKDPLVAEAEEARVTWMSQRLSNYEYTYQTPCFCAFIDPVIVVVENDKVVQVLDKESKETYTIIYGGEDRSILEVYPELFLSITEFYDQWINKIPEVYKAELEWDRQTGMLEYVYFDYIKDAIDDEITYLFSGLKLN